MNTSNLTRNSSVRIHLHLYMDSLVGQVFFWCDSYYDNLGTTITFAINVIRQNYK